MRVGDLNMVRSFNGGEREVEDWVRLIDGVRPGLRLVRWEQPKGSAMAVLIFERNGSRDT